MSATNQNDRPSQPRCRHGRRGLSFIEILIVVTLLGILTAAALPYLSPSVPQQLQTGGDILSGDVDYVRGLAVANNSSYRFTFNVSGNSYLFEHTGTNTALNPLPPSPFYSTSANGRQQTVLLANIPGLLGSVKLAGVVSNAATPVAVTDLEIGPQGSTSRTTSTTVWLCSDAAGPRQYLGISVNPTTGLADIGQIQQAKPAGIP